MPKKLTSQEWIINGEEDFEKNMEITVNFTAFKEGTEMNIFQGKNIINFTEEQIKELQNILESTKYIFNQNE